MSRQRWLLWTAANSVSVAIAFSSLLVRDPISDLDGLRLWLFF